MSTEINIADLYIGSQECIDYHLSKIETDSYLQSMIKDIKKLPAVTVIDLGDCYSLSDGHHRLAVHLFLKLTTIKANIIR